PFAVTTPGGTATSAPFTIATPPVPVITGVSPTSGPPGTTVTITGTGFANPAEVTIGYTNTPANFRVDSPTTITAMVPVAAESGAIRVGVLVAGAGSSTVGGPDIFGYLPGTFTITQAPPPPPAPAPTIT